MKIIPNARRVLLRAWSVRLMLIAGLLTAFQAALPIVGEAGLISPELFAGLTLIVVFAAFVARFVYQEDVHEDET